MERTVDWVGPGELMRLTLRKRFVDDEVRSAIEKGAEQLLVVGAGFDTLGLRIAESFPGVTVVELDAPATARLRNKAIAGIESLHSNYHLEGVDLASTKLSEVLAAMAAWGTTSACVQLRHDR
jgi:O-methyltransferase involved in polyketide biosynthesis